MRRYTRVLYGTLTVDGTGALATDDVSVIARVDGASTVVGTGLLPYS